MKFSFSIPLLALCAGMALAPGARAGTIFVSSRESSNGAVYQYDLTGTLLQSLTGNGLYNAQGLALGPNGNLFVVSESGSVLQYNAATGAFISEFATLGGSPGPLAFGPDGNLYVGTNSSVLKFDGLTGASLGTFASGNGLNSPTGLAFDASGNLFVADGVSGTIAKFDSAGAFVSNFVSGNPLLSNGAGKLLFFGDELLVSATYGNGQTWGDTVLAFAADGSSLGNFISDPHLIGPSGMAFGPDGNFYVVNYAGGGVERFTAAGVYIDTFIANNPQSGVGIVFVPDATSGDGESGVPEPATVALLGFGLVAIALRRRQG